MTSHPDPYTEPCYEYVVDWLIDNMLPSQLERIELYQQE